MACGILVLHRGIKPRSPALEAQSLNHRTTREVPLFYILKSPIWAGELCFFSSSLLICQMQYAKNKMKAFKMGQPGTLSFSQRQDSRLKSRASSVLQCVSKLRPLTCNWSSQVQRVPKNLSPSESHEVKLVAYYTEGSKFAEEKLLKDGINEQLFLLILLPPLTWPITCYHRNRCFPAHWKTQNTLC